MISSRPSTFTKIVIGAVGAVLFYLPIQETLAQELEEITVTARRYEERITDAPLAIAVMSSEFLDENRVNTVQDILELTPGANWGQFAKAQPNLGLRGINGAAFGNASLEHAVSVVQDGVPITKAFMMTIPVYDQDRVEVMRGPQGTTFGRNATLGLMHFISARPSQETSGSLEVSAGERDLFGVNGHYNGALSDTVSARFAFNYSDDPGPMDDEATGDVLDYSKNTSIRGSLLIEPSETFSAYIKLEYMEDEEFPTVRRGGDRDVQWLNGNYGSYVSNSDPWKATLSPDPAGAPWIVEREMTFLTAEFNWALDNDINLTAIAGYLDGEHYSNSDAFGTPYDIRDQLVWNEADETSLEVRLDNAASGNRFRWLVGASYLTDEEHRVEINESEPLRGNCNFTDPTGCPRNSVLVTEGTNTTDAFGLFGEVNFDLSDALTLAVGGRYSTDDRSLDYATDGWGAAGGLGGIGLDNPDPTRDCNAIIESGTTPGQCGTEANPVGYVGSVSEDWSNFSPKVSLTWALNDNNNIYALYSEGFKAGGFQQDARWLAALDLILDEEESTNIELGWKGSYDSVVFAVTLFQQEQLGIHTGNLVAVGSSQSNLLVNAKGIENTGFEVEATWAATDNLTIGGHLASYSPEFVSGTIINGRQNADGTISGGEDVSGTKPANSVDRAAYIWAAYDWELSGGSSLRVRADVQDRGTVWGQNGANNRAGRNLNDDGFMYLRPAITKTGIRVEWTSAEGNMGFSVWGRNLDDDPDYINYGPGFGYVYLRGPDISGPGTGVRARPVGSTGRRQVGATFRYQF
jgi:iron complex outermembrane receptor protein